VEDRAMIEMQFKIVCPICSGDKVQQNGTISFPSQPEDDYTAHCIACHYSAPLRDFFNESIVRVVVDNTGESE